MCCWRCWSSAELPEPLHGVVQCLCTALCEHGALLPASIGENHTVSPCVSLVTGFLSSLGTIWLKYTTRAAIQGWLVLMWKYCYTWGCVILADFKTWNNDKGSKDAESLPMKVTETLQLLLDIFPVQVVTATIIFFSWWESTKMLWQTLQLLLLFQWKIMKICFTWHRGVQRLLLTCLPDFFLWRMVNQSQITWERVVNLKKRGY